MKHRLTLLTALLLVLLAALHAAEPSKVAPKSHDDQRLIEYVHDTSVNPFIVSSREPMKGGAFPVANGGFPDLEPIYMDGVWHLYSMGNGPHFTSTDLVKWVEHEGTGVNGETGCVIHHGDKYYRFYTSSQTIRVAVSDNPWKFDPAKSLLAAEADDKTYKKGWFRDAYVFFNDEEKIWWMLIEGRCPEVCTGLFKSKDLLRWTQCEPLLKDAKRKYGSCPQVFRQGKLWYLVLQDLGNHYYTAENLNGPWMYRGNFLNNRVEAARLASDGKRHIAWGWLSGKGYGGPMSVGREIVFKADGTMEVRPIPELLAAIRKSRSKVDLFACAKKVSGEWKIQADKQTLQCKGESGGVLVFDLPEKNPNCYFEAEVEFDSPKSTANVILRSSETGDGGYGFAFSPAFPGDRKINIRDVSYKSDGKLLGNRIYDFSENKKVSLQIFICDNFMEVFLDGRASMTAPVMDQSGSKVAIEIGGGSATISKPFMRYFKSSLKGISVQNGGSVTMKNPLIAQLPNPQVALQAADAPSTKPTYHFTRPRGNDRGAFDPNGAIFFKGRYHLGYIDEDGGKWFWGHVSTVDLIHWQMHPPMLSRGPEDMISSGNAFMDKRGRVVLCYDGRGNNSPLFAGGTCLAIAQDDDLNIFRKLEANPLIKNPDWDPHAWLEDGTYYCINGVKPNSSNVTSLYTSSDDALVKWDLVGPLMSHEMPDVFANEDISCPDLFKLGDKYILLCISHIRGARYYVGSFDGKNFRPEAHYRMNWPGGTCFAPETLLDAKGRRIMWAWVLGRPYTLSLPRVLSLGADGVMHIEPVEELNLLRMNPLSLKDVVVSADANVEADGVKGDCKELQITIDPQQATQCGVKVRCSPDGAEETAIVYDPAHKVLRIEMDKSSLNKNVKPRTYAMTFMLPKGSENPEVSAQEAPFELKPGELLELHIYLDHSIMEVFANGRQCITQRIYPTRDDSVGVAFFARGGAAKVVSLEAWDMNPTTMTPLEAQMK